MSSPQAQPEPGDTPPADSLVGTTVGRFAIRARLGAGGMGEVYRGHDPKLNRPVALKRIAPALRNDASYRRRFLKEAERASQLTDPHIAGVYDVLEENGELLLVMEYVEGQTLRDRLRQRISEARPLPGARSVAPEDDSRGGVTAEKAALGTDELLELAVQCCEGLQAAHNRGIIHCDIKPENIMLTPQGRVKILDFGVARQAPVAGQGTLDTVTSLPGSSGGTPAYMAPEILLVRDFDARADIFSLGVVLYEALAAKHPFLAPSLAATSDRVLHETPAPLRQINSKVPAAVDSIVAKMLAKNPAARHASAADLLADLRAVQRDPTAIVAEPIARAPAEKKPLPARRVRPAAWIAAILAVAILIAAALTLATRQRLGRWLAVRAVMPAQKHLAVLPFMNVGGDPANKEFCDGFTYILTSKLTQLEQFQGSLFVVPASEVIESGVSSGQDARKRFGVNMVLTGSVQRAGDRLLLTASLADTETLRTMRSLTLDVGADDPVALETALAVQLAGMLEVGLQPEAQRLLAAGATAVPRAHDLYLQGWGYLRDYDKPENVDRAASLFRQATDLDPRYALAYAGLGQVYWQKYRQTHDSKWVSEARTACEQAALLDPGISGGHTCLGTVYSGTGKYEQAVEQFQQALRLEPTSEAYRGLGQTYERQNKLPDAEKTYQKAISLRPNYWAGHNSLGAFYFNHGRYREAAESFERVVALSRDNFLAYGNLGAAYLLQGRYDEGLKALQRQVAIRPKDPANARPYSNMASAYFLLRRFDEAVVNFERAAALAPRDHVLWGNLGDAYYWMPAKRPQAAGAFEKAIALVEEDLQVNPRDPGLLASAALYRSMLDQKKGALEYLRQALALGPANHNVLFKEARIHNHFGETDATFGSLQKALAAGYSATEVRDTPIFDNLRADPRLQRLLGSGKQVNR